MKDFEQLYYDSIYENKKIIEENNKLKQEIEIYKTLSQNKQLNKIIAKDLIKYLSNKNNQKNYIIGENKNEREN